MKSTVTNDHVMKQSGVTRRQALKAIWIPAAVLVIGISLLGRPTQTLAAENTSAGSSVVTEESNSYPYEEWRDTFPNGIFKWGTSSFPTERFNYRLRVEKIVEGELGDAFKDLTFSDVFGELLKEEYLEGRLIEIYYAVKEPGNFNTKEIAVAFKVGEEFYVGFLPATNEKITLLKKFNKR